MFEVKYNYLGFYKSINVDEKKSIDKWSPVIKHLKIDNPTFIKKVSIFAEKYYIMEQQITSYNPISSLSTPRLPSLLEQLKNEYEKFILNDSKTKLNIVSEYYNALTGKRGLLLEHNIRIEDGKFLNLKHNEKIEKIVSDFLDKAIEYTIDPERRKFIDREDKIRRILKWD